MEKYLIFRTANHEFALDIKSISKIIDYVEPQGVPETSVYVLGMIQQSGGVLPVVSLSRRLFGIAESEIAQKKVVIALWKGKEIGFVVESIQGIYGVTDSEVERSNPELKIARNYVVGYIKREDRLITILDTEELFALDQELELMEMES